jgi:hypothetical protein
MLKIVDLLVDPVSKILDKVVADKDLKEQLAHDIATMAQRHHHELMIAQIEVNKQEAKGNWFQSSWRPATGWVCVSGFAINFLISPLAVPFGIEIPQADTTVMLPVLLGMLGIGGFRTFEKTQDIHGK